jgi:hypothetical protein
MSEQKAKAANFLRKHFEVAKAKYPEENWQDWGEFPKEVEFVVKAMLEFAASQNVSGVPKLSESDLVLDGLLRNQLWDCTHNEGALSEAVSRMKKFLRERLSGVNNGSDSAEPQPPLDAFLREFITAQCNVESDRVESSMEGVMDMLKNYEKVLRNEPYDNRNH